MNPIDLVNMANNLTGAGMSNGGARLQQMQTDDVELRLMLADVYQHLGIQPRENVRECAQQILTHMNMEQAYAMAQQKYYDRQYAYSNGSVVERFRRLLGGHPNPPMHPYQQMQMGHQVIPMPTPYLPQGQMANTQPVGFNQPTQAPQPTSGDDERIKQLEAQMNQMNQALSQITQYIGSQGQGGN